MIITSNLTAGATTATVVKPLPCQVQFSYDTSDPYAVTLTIFGTDSIVWIFGRDLLIDGLVKTQGEGDVQVVPTFTDISIVLTVKEESARLAFPRKKIVPFIENMRALVPTGSEGLLINWDEEFSNLEG